MKILFQGDSITDAFRKPEELNPAFQLGNGYVFLIAAKLAAHYPDRGFEFTNRGVSGETSGDLLARWSADAIQEKPDVLSLLVGINDVISHFSGCSPTDASQFAHNYTQLLDQTRRANPAVKLILLEPFLLPAGEDRTAWKELLHSLQGVLRKLACDYDAIFIPLQKIFDETCAMRPAEHWSYDGIHPTHAGFQLIADAWLQKTWKLRSAIT